MKPALAVISTVKVRHRCVVINDGWAFENKQKGKTLRGSWSQATRPFMGEQLLSVSILLFEHV